MNNKRKVLWVEDGVRFDIPFYAAPIEMDGEYDLIVADTASAAVSYLRVQVFDAVIVDIRLWPGEDRAWIDEYQRCGHDKVTARLGRKLLYSLLDPSNAQIQLLNMPRWIGPDRFGVLTVEPFEDLKQDFVNLGLSPSVYREKALEAPDLVLLELIQHVIERHDATTP